MSVNGLKWAAVALPVAFVTFLLVTLDPWSGPVLESWPALLAFIAALALGAFLFATVVFGWVDRSQRASDARTSELQALNELGNQLMGERSDDAIAALTIACASRILDARAIGVQVQRCNASTWTVAGEWKADLDAWVGSQETPSPGAPQPVTFDDGRTGLVLAASLGPGGALYALIAPRDDDVQVSALRLMDGIATHASLALERSLLLEDVQRRERRTRALYDVGLEIVSAQDLARVLKLVTVDACSLVGARAAALCLVNEADGTLVLAQTAGDADFLFASQTNQSGMTFARAGRLPMLAGAAPSCAAVMGAPGAQCLRSHLIVGSAVVGELCVAHDGAEPFGEDDRHLLAGLADMAAIAIHNARLRERERQVAILEERDHLAREMHDTLAQVLGYLHLKSATIRKRLESGELAGVGDDVQEMQDLAHEAYVDVREAILGLRETVAPAGGIVGGLRQYMQKFSRQSGIEARLYAPAAAGIGLAPEAEIQLLRVVQEALTNVRKHASARSAAVHIDTEDAYVRVVIEDDGTGFDASRVDRDEGRSFGLRSMKERVERAGGQLGIESAPGSGTRILVLLPLNEGGNRHVAYEDSPGG